MPLSAKQMEYLALAWQCFETEPKVDYQKFHLLAGLASANSGRELLRVTKKKLREEYGNPSGEGGAVKTGGRTASVAAKSSSERGKEKGKHGRKRARNEDENDDDDDDDDDVEAEMREKGEEEGTKRKKKKQDKNEIKAEPRDEEVKGAAGEEEGFDGVFR